ncbi:MAG: hypothetical protein ACKOZT_04860 [Cyanobium sp.]
MTSASMGPPLHDPAAIERWLAEANPGHYRLLALYLQVLREIVPESIDRAVFQIATQIHPERYAALPPSRRRELHRILSILVRRTTSLLTVEQVWSLAARLHEQRQRRRRRRQRLLVQRLIEASAEEELTPSDGLEAVHGREDPSGMIDSFPQGLTQAMPPGSVQLGLTLPLQGDPFGWTASSWEPFSTERERSEARQGVSEGGQHRSQHEAAEDAFDADGTRHATPDHEDQAEDEDDEDDQSGDEDNDNYDEEDDCGDEDNAAAAADHPRHDQQGTQDDDDLIPEADGLFLATGSEGLLPRDPILLDRWLELYEQALTRRLRHLSHAINTELMRSGLLPLLLPGSLLDAVLEGRIDTLGAAPNLLRMELPMPIAGHGGTLQATVVLLRCADLELEQPRLRNLGRTLKQRRQEGRRMAEHLRRLRRRLQARKAETLWLQDIRSRLSGQDPAAQQP